MMVFTFNTCLVLLLLGKAISTLAADSCPAFGTEFAQGHDTTRNGLWLNFDTPAQCSGTAVQWRFCYYVVYTDDDHEVWLRVYRKNGSSDTYDRVVEDIIKIKDLRNSADLSNRNDAVCVGESPPYCCENKTVTVNYPILQNDIIGVCMRDAGRHDPLYSLDEEAPAGYTVYEYPNTDDCNMAGDVVSFVASDESLNLTPMPEFGLHAHLNIMADTAACSVGSNPPPFTTSTTSGLYLNLESPAQCNGLITTWHYCYYPPSVAGNRSFTVRVWRLNQAAQQYNLVGSSRTITVMAETSLASVICGTETLMEESDYMSINENDFIGVIIPPSSPLPVVASGASDYSLKRFDDINVMSFGSTALQDLPDQALHLHADIMMTTPPVPATTTPPVPATTAPPEPATTAPPVPATTAPPVPATTSLDTGSNAVFTPTSSPNIIVVSSSTTTPSHGGSNGDVTTTSSGVPVITVESPPPPMDSPSGVDGGLVAGIIVAMVIIAALLAVVIVLLLFLRRRSKSYRMKADSQPQQMGAINNVVYDTSAGVAVLRSDTIAKTTPQGISNITYECVDPIYELADKNLQFEDTPETFYSAIGDIPEYQYLIEQAKQDGDVIYGDPSPYCVPAQEEDELYKQIKYSGIERIAKNSIELTDYLGSGEFGRVEQGTMKTASGAVIDVAVKTLPDDATQIDKVRFLQEAVIMAQFKHPNVVNMYGVVKDKALLMLIVELLPKGDLRNFLLTMRPDPGQLLPTYIPKQLLAFCQQVALGMQYLSIRGFVHRDLAARNVLVSAKGVCKIGDFGMSRDLADDTYYVSQGGKIPVKWTAPEAIHFKKYSTVSDVWSYGCLLYEIWSIGHKPFEDYKNVEVIRKVDTGYRLPPPPGCPMAVYDVMIQCWHRDTASRPAFRDILLILLGNEADILEIPSDALSSHRQAGVLGAPLKAGDHMYRNLQGMYT